MKRLFKWLDGLNKLSPVEKAEIEWEQTRLALLEAISHKEHYESQTKLLSQREQRLSIYLGKT